MEKSRLKKLHEKFRMQRLAYEKEFGRKSSKTWSKNKTDESSRTSRRKIKQRLSNIKYNKEEME